MFDFIGNILENITDFFRHLIVLAVVLLLLAGHRNRNNPYRDHTKERIEQQIETEREAKYKESLQRLYDEQYGK